MGSRGQGAKGGKGPRGAIGLILSNLLGRSLKLGDTREAFDKTHENLKDIIKFANKTAHGITF